MKVKLGILFSFIFLAMLGVTSWAGYNQNFFEGGARIIAEPWGIATLFDTYFAFLTFFVWVCFRERGFAARAVWFVLIMTLGNIAMAAYVLLALRGLGPNASARELLLPGRAS